jgi:hypothetical protein
MSDPHTTLQPGDKGTVSLVDSIGTIFVDWDNGSGLGVAYGEDRVRRLEPEREKPSLLGQVEKHKAAAASKPEKPAKEPELEL